MFISEAISFSLNGIFSKFVTTQSSLIYILWRRTLFSWKNYVVSLPQVFFLFVFFFFFCFFTSPLFGRKWSVHKHLRKAQHECLSTTVCDSLCSDLKGILVLHQEPTSWFFRYCCSLEWPMSREFCNWEDPSSNRSKLPGRKIPPPLPPLRVHSSGGVFKLLDQLSPNKAPSIHPSEMCLSKTFIFRVFIYLVPSTQVKKNVYRCG